MIKLDDIEMAFEFVSSGPRYDHSAYVSRSSGQIYYRSEMAGEDELPEGSAGDPDLVEIPHKHDLDLGKHLVLEFADAQGGDLGDRVRDIFSRRGAYARFKDLLERRRLLERWYEYEASETRRRLREWCEAESLELED